MSDAEKDIDANFEHDVLTVNLKMTQMYDNVNKKMIGKKKVISDQIDEPADEGEEGVESESMPTPSKKPRKERKERKERTPRAPRETPLTVCDLVQT